MLTVIVILKALAEVAGLSLLGQGLLYLLAGANRERNLFYQILQTITLPLWKLTRWITPRVIVDQHIGALAFLLVVMLWYLLVVGQAAQCLSELKHPSCGRLLSDYVQRCEAGRAEACELLRRNDLAPVPPPG